MVWDPPVPFPPPTPPAPGAPAWAPPIVGEQMLEAQAAATAAQGLDAMAAAAAVTGEIDDALAAAVIDAPSLAAVYEAAGAGGAAEVADGLGIVFDSLPGSDEAASWAAEHAAKRVSSISDQAREVLARITAEAQRDGLSVPDTARQIRQHVGLTAQQSKALAVYEAGLDGPPGSVAGRVEALRRRMLNHRATTIARTELLASANAGRERVWQLGVTSGALGIDAIREWLVAPGCCDLCSALSGTRARLGEVFEGTAVVHPPRHPRCRCTTVIVSPGTAQGGLVGDSGWAPDPEAGVPVFAGTPCALCPNPGNGACKLKASADNPAGGGVLCSGIPGGAPANSVPVTDASQVDVGDLLFKQGEQNGYLVLGAGTKPGTVSIKTGSGSQTVPVGPDGKFGVVPGPVKAGKAAEKWKAARTGSLPEGAPVGAVPVSAAAAFHPGDVLYHVHGGKLYNATVVGYGQPGEVAVLAPGKSKPSFLSIDAKANAGKPFGCVPSPDKGIYLTGGVGSWSVKPPVDLSAVSAAEKKAQAEYLAAKKKAKAAAAPPPPPPTPVQTWTPAAGKLTSHADFPGNSYLIESVDATGKKAVIATEAGSKFAADTSKLIGLRPGTKLNAPNGNVVHVVGPVMADGRIKVQHATLGVVTENVGVFKPGTATPGKGAAAGVMQAPAPASAPAKKAPAAPAKKAPAKKAPAKKAPATSAASSGSAAAYGPPMAHAEGARSFASQTEAVAWAKRTYTSWATELIPERWRQALRKYTGNTYTEWNGLLRRGTPLSEMPNGAVLAARALREKKFDEDVILTRGSGDRISGSVGSLRDAPVGHTWTEPAFHSTSVTPSAAFGGEVAWRIRAPKGSAGGYVDDISLHRGEYELVLPPGTTFRIDGKTQEGGRLFVDVTIVAQEGVTF